MVLTRILRRPLSIVVMTALLLLSNSTALVLSAHAAPKAQPAVGCAPGDDLNGNGTCDDFEYLQEVPANGILDPDDVFVCVAAKWDTIRLGKGAPIPAPTYVRTGSGEPRLVQWSSPEDLDQLVQAHGPDAFLGVDGNDSCWGSETTTLDPNGADLRGSSVIVQTDISNELPFSNLWIPDDVPPIDVGSGLIWAISVYNFGPASPDSISAKFTLPPGTELVDAVVEDETFSTWVPCDTSALPTVTCEITELPLATGSIGAWSDAAIWVVLNTAGPLSIPVSLSSTLPDPNPTNNYMSLPITVIGEDPPEDCNIAWAWVTLDESNAVGGDVDPSEGCQVTLSIENLRTKWTAYSITADPATEVGIQPDLSASYGLLPPAPFTIRGLTIEILLDLIGQGKDIQHLLSFTEAGQSVRVDVYPTTQTDWLNIIQLFLDAQPYPLAGDYVSKLITGANQIDVAFAEMPNLRQAATILFGPDAGVSSPFEAAPHLLAFAADPAQLQRLAQLILDLDVLAGSWAVDGVLDLVIDGALNALSLGSGVLVAAKVGNAILKFLGAYDFGRSDTGSIMVVTSPVAPSIDCRFAPDLCKGF